MVKWVLTEPDSDKALRLRDDLRNSVHELLSPDIFTVEAAHALHVLRGSCVFQQDRLDPCSWIS